VLYDASATRLRGTLETMCWRTASIGHRTAIGIGSNWAWVQLSGRARYQAGDFTRLEILAIVARLHPVAFWMVPRRARRRACGRCWRCALCPPGGPYSGPRPSPSPVPGLGAPSIVIVLPGDRSEHVEQHTVDCLKHAPREFVGVGGCHHPRRWQVQRHDAQAPRREFGPEAFPVCRGEAGQAIDLLDEEDVAGLRVRDKPEQLRPDQLGAALVLDIAGGDLQPALGDEGAILGRF